MKILMVIGSVLLLGLGYLNLGNQPEAIAEGTQSYQLLQKGPYRVKAEKLEFVDTSRSIPANGDYEGSGERRFDVYLWSPAQKPASPMPLVVYSHGFMSNGQGGDYLGKYLASHGYTFAAPTFPLTHYGAPGGPFVGDVVNQPGDVSFIIDTLLARSANPDDRLHGFIDASRVAAAGLSLGGMTSTLVAFHPLNADRRVSLALSIAGPAYPFSKRFFNGREIPFMMVATPIDAMVAYDENAANILDKVPQGVLVTIDGASHAGFSSVAKWLRWMNNPDSIGCKALMQNVDFADEAAWYESLGGAAVGVEPSEAPEMCIQDPLPAAMNPLRQHQLNILAVSSFLACHFGQVEEERERSCGFLLNTFPKEFDEISVRRG